MKRRVKLLVEVEVGLEWTDGDDCGDCPLVVDPDPYPCYCKLFEGGGITRTQECLKAEVSWVVPAWKLENIERELRDLYLVEWSSSDSGRRIADLADEVEKAIEESSDTKTP